MNLHFRISFHTQPGESLFIEGVIRSSEGNSTSFSCEMQYKGEGLWEFDVAIEPLGQTLEYRYVLKNREETLRAEWGSRRSLFCDPLYEEMIIDDYWQDLPAGAPFYTSAFTDTFFRRDEAMKLIPSPMDGNITVRVWCPTVKSDEYLVFCGEEEELGEWNPLAAPRMSCSSFPEWEIRFSSSNFPRPFKYKFVIVSATDREVVQWEQGEDRVFNHESLPSNRHYTLSGLHFRLNDFNWRAAGISIPVFSLRSETSSGIGDFTDLIPLVDWAVQSGLKVVQLLPVNDTTMTHTWRDSYPYNTNSNYALHPLYINLDAMGTLHNESKRDDYHHRGMLLNQLPEVDYEAVSELKWSYFRDLYDQEGEATLNSESCKQFIAQNREWLIPYAAFCYLRDKYDTPDFHLWGNYSEYNVSTIESLFDPTSPSYADVAIHLFLQYHLHIQLSQASNYARTSGVIFKGDIPIGISRTSVEAWTEPRLFRLDSQAGAPPDPFSTTGQNWGFPTYNWEEMAKDGFLWWKKRFVKMADYFDAYRIDHILGFFRIWEIPLHSVQGLLGCFNPSLPLALTEIEQTGFPIEYTTMQPYIRRWYLDELFGEYTPEVLNRFIDRPEPTVYRLKPEFDTQRKVEAFFAGQSDSKCHRIREGLYALINNVLFVPDPYRPQRFHPRIAAQESVVYRSLAPHLKEIFDRIYYDYYFHRHTDFWRYKAYEKLPTLIYATRMMACAEDLGMIPSCVPDVLRTLQIHSLEVERMPKESDRQFANVAGYPYLSVCTTSTHDMSTIRQWWMEDRALSQQYYNGVLRQKGVAPIECTPEICTQIVVRHLQSPSMLTILPLQDWLSIDAKMRTPDYENERINIPSNPRHYWRYRMHLSLEQLIAANTFSSRVRELIEISEREC